MGLREIMQKQETASNGHGVRVHEPVFLPRKGQIRYRLVDFAGRRNILHVAKPTAEGRYKNDKYQIDVPIDGSALWNGGTEAWIDVNRGVQIVNFDGARGWVGIDGKFSYRAEVGKQWGLILAAKAGDLLKWAKLGVIVTCVAFAVLLVAVIVLAGQVGG